MASSCLRRAGRASRSWPAQIALGGVFLTLCVGAAPAGAQVETLNVRQPTAVMVSALGTAAVWSSHRRGVGYVLVARVEGSTFRLPVAPRRRPFDVDLGRGPAGSLIAAYSRCAREPDGISAEPGFPRYGDGRRCRLFVYDFARRRERRVRGLPGGPHSQFLPSVWGDRIAFAQVPRGGVRGITPVYLASGYSRRSPRVTRVGHGARGNPELTPDLAAARPVAIDLQGKHVAFSWYVTPVRACPRIPGTEGDLGLGTRTEIWVSRAGGRPRRLDLACARGTPGLVLGPAVKGNRVVFARRTPAPEPPGGPEVSGFTLTILSAPTGRTVLAETETIELLPEGPRILPVSVAIGEGVGYAGMSDGSVIAFSLSVPSPFG